MHTRIVLEKEQGSSSFAIDDRIFLGEGLFETLKVESAQACFSHLHWQRLSDSAMKLGIPFEVSFGDWQESLNLQIKRDNLYRGGIKAILSGGTAPRGLSEHGQVSQLMFQSFNYTLESHPLRLCSVPWLRDGANPIYQFKSVNYLEAIMARRHALAKNYEDALFFNTAHHATETTCANLFIITNNQLLTPPLNDGVLPGITRARVFSLALQYEIPCKERSLTKAMIEEAESVFVTNSLQGLRRISSLDNHNFVLTHPLWTQLEEGMQESNIHSAWV